MNDQSPLVDDPFDGDIDIPPTVDEAAVRRMEFVSSLLDDCVRIPGTDIGVGLDPVLGVLPGAGDVVAAGVSLYLILESARLGVSITTLVRMLANVAVDVALGSVPVVGVLFDVLWQANVKNLELALDDLADAADDSTGRLGDDNDRDGGAVTIEVE